MIQPMEAELYFDDIEGFREWSILIVSIQVQRRLRDFKRADITIFRIVMKVRWDLKA